METLLHFFQIAERSSLRGLPPEIPMSEVVIIFYCVLLYGMLRGDTRFYQHGGAIFLKSSEQGKEDHFSGFTRVFNAILEHDEHVRNVLQAVSAASGEEAAWAIIPPAGLTRDDLKRINTSMWSALDAAEQHHPLMPAEQDVVVRRVLSEEARRYGIEFPVVR